MAADEKFGALPINDIKVGYEAPLSVIKAIWLYDAMKHHRDSKFPFKTIPKRQRKNKEGVTTWCYYWKVCCNEKDCEAFIDTKSELQHENHTFYSVKKNHEIEWPRPMAVTKCNLKHTCNPQVEVMEYEFASLYPKICIQCCVDTTATNRSCIHCKSPWCKGQRKELFEAQSICRDCYSSQRHRRKQLTKLFDATDALFGSEGKSLALLRLPFFDEYKDAAVEFFRSIDSIVGGKEKEEAGYVRNDQDPEDLPLPRHKCTISQFCDSEFAKSVFEANATKKYDGLEEMGDNQYGKHIDECVIYNDYLRSLATRSRKYVLNHHQVKYSFIGAALAPFYSTKEYKALRQKFKSLAFTTTSNEEILSQLITDPFVTEQLQISLHAASLHIQRIPDSDTCKQHNFKGDANSDDLTAFYLHRDKFGGFVMFQQLYGMSFSYVAVPSNSKEPWFDTTDAHGSSWKDYSKWKAALSQEDLKSVASLEDHIKNDVKKNYSTTTRILVFLLVPGQRLCFAAGIYPHGSMIVPRRLIPEQFRIDDPEINGIARALLVWHDFVGRNTSYSKKGRDRGRN